jgi:hypothetical protein
MKRGHIAGELIRKETCNRNEQGSERGFSQLVQEVIMSVFLLRLFSVGHLGETVIRVIANYISLDQLRGVMQETVANGENQ